MDGGAPYTTRTITATSNGVYVGAGQRYAPNTSAKVVKTTALEIAQDASGEPTGTDNGGALVGHPAPSARIAPHAAR